MRYAGYGMAALAAWVTFGCDSTATTPRSLIVEPRVLAIRAEPPVVAPNGTVELSALVADATGEPRIANTSFRACSPWQFVTEPSEDCGPESSIALAAPPGEDQGAGAVLDMTDMLAAFPPPPWYEPQDDEDEDDEADGDEAAPCAADYRFLEVPVIFTAEAERAPLVAMKRVRVSEPGIVRRNPEIAEIFINGESGVTTFRHGETYELSASMQPESLDESCLEDGQTALEPVELYVYSDAGEVNGRDIDVEYTAEGEEVAGRVTWNAPEASGNGEPDTVRLWIVAIDTDGGTSWLSLTLTAE